jgi:predicted nuclease of predicted toxin-antitoxin system
VWLIDNNVPRQVTVLLRDLGHDVLEVRAVLAANAADAAIAALARASGRRVITHDIRFARACWRDAIPHLWLRTAETEDRERIHATLAAIERCFGDGALRVVLSRLAVVCEGKAA